MGNTEVRNPLFSKEMKHSEVRILIIDDNQIRFNQICELLHSKGLVTKAILLDDVKIFEKQLSLTWDLVIFGRAYDLKVDQALILIHHSKQPKLPLLLLKPDEYDPSQYTDFIYKGIYDILNLDFPERFYCGLFRTLTYSRLQQKQNKLSNALETAQNHAQYLVEESNKAIATIQEGIHIHANPEYLALFGLNSEDDVIGLPILDIIKPKQITDFKNRVKKALQGHSDLGVFQLESENPKLNVANPLNIEFLNTNQKDTIQLTIDYEANSLKNSAHIHVFQKINQTLENTTSPYTALVVFSLSSCPDDILNADWNSYKTYFQNIRTFLKEQCQIPIFKLDTLTYLGLIQTATEASLNTKLNGLNILNKPQLIEMNGIHYPLSLRLGHAQVQHEIKNHDALDQLISEALTKTHHTPVVEEHAVETLSFSQDEIGFNLTDITIEPSEASMTIERIPQNTLLDIEFKLDHSAPMPQEIFAPTELSPKKIVAEDSEISQLIQCLEKGEIHLKYQQLYDKEDINLYTFEVTSGFIHNKTWINCNHISALAEYPDLSIQLDRWILVEACKQLHHFISQYPEVRLIINLNKHILLNDQTLPSFIDKLATIVGSPLDVPLTLQFSTDDLSPHMEEIRKQIFELKKSGALISLRDFGKSIYSEQLLAMLELTGITLDQSLTQLLESEEGTQELNEKLAHFQEVRPVHVLLRELNNMNLFANAWDVNARYIQGDYFQKKLDHLSDVQDL